MELDNSKSLSLRAGYLFQSESMLFGRIGRVTSDTNLELSDKKVDVWQAGFAIQALVMDNLSVVGQYTYTDYDKFTANTAFREFSTDGAVRTRNEFSSSELTLGLTYHF